MHVRTCTGPCAGMPGRAVPDLAHSVWGDVKDLLLSLQRQTGVQRQQHPPAHMGGMGRNVRGRGRYETGVFALLEV